VTVPEIEGCAWQKEYRVTYRGAEYESIHPSRVRTEAIMAKAPLDARIAVNGCGTLTTNIAGGKMYLPYVTCIPRVRAGSIEGAVL
jgi:nitrogen regulatory protein PII